MTRVWPGWSSESPPHSLAMVGVRCCDRLGCPAGGRGPIGKNGHARVGELARCSMLLLDVWAQGSWVRTGEPTVGDVRPRR